MTSSPSNSFSPDSSGTMARQTLLGSCSIFIGASIWGLFWLQLEYFNENGLRLLWAVAAMNFCGLIPATIAALLFGKSNRDAFKWQLIVGLGMGIAIAFYMAGLMLSDVVRVVFLFYLLPLWATLLSWLLFGVQIGKQRMIGLGVAVFGIWLLLGSGGWPIPKNLGDVFGILSGFAWAFCLTMVRGKGSIDPFETTAISLFFGCVIALCMGLLMTSLAPAIQPPMPGLEPLWSLALPLLGFSILIYWPSMLSQIWGAQFVAATTAALLTMSEILAATVSTYLLGSTNMTLISWVGAGLIVCAIFIDLSGEQNG